jgi:hypothetical protein
MRFLLTLSLAASVACHPGPVVNTNPTAAGGTIAGIVTTNGNAPVTNRKVTAVNTATGARHEATTGANGGYTIQVPEGSYRLELELRPGETIAKDPGEIRINRSDLDAQRNFVIAVRR